MNNTTKAPSVEEQLVANVFQRLGDTAFKAALKKADNPDTEYQSWEYLAEYGINLQYDNCRLPYSTVFAAVARSAWTTDGSLSLGSALAAAYPNEQSSPPARSRLRRILACSTVEETCSVLRPILRFIGSKKVAVSYGKLLHDLKYFELNPEQAKARWAQQFFGKTSENTDGETNA